MQQHAERAACADAMIVRKGLAHISFYFGEEKIHLPAHPLGLRGEPKAAADGEILAVLTAIATERL